MTLFSKRRSGDRVFRMALGCTKILVAILVFHELLTLILLRVSRGNHHKVHDAMIELGHHEQVMALVFMSAYGFFRSIRFHPARDRRYRQWLALTPWSATDRLPLGSVLLTWADVAPLVTGALVTWVVGDWQPLIPAIGFFAAYLVGALGWLNSTKRWEWWATAYGLGLVLLLLPRVSAAWILGISVALYLRVRRAFLSSLHEFPWGLDDPKPAAAITKWPLSQIGPAVLETRSEFDRVRGICNASVLIGWWVFCLLSTLDGDEFNSPLKRLNVVYWCIGVGEAIAFFRWCAYRINCHPPISLWGRVRTGIWIIPRYDHALLAPWLLVLLAAAVPLVLNALRLPIPVLAAVSATLTLSLAVLLGPALSRWRLTGQYQMLPMVQRVNSRTAP